MNQIKRMTMVAMCALVSFVACAADVAFETGGDASWFKQSGVTYDGTPAWQVGDLTEAAAESEYSVGSWISMKVQGPCTLSFQFGFQGESSSFGAYLDDDYISLDHGWGSGLSWKKNEIAISASGEHEVKISCWYWSNWGIAQPKYWIADVQRTPAPVGVTVSFDANGGYCTTSSRYFSTGSTYSNLPDPYRSVGEFLGWYTAATGGERVDESDYVKFNVTRLYAHWGMPIEEALGVGSDVDVDVGVDWQIGEPAWCGNVDQSYDGDGCACAGGGNSSKSFSVTVEGPGTLSFVMRCCNASSQVSLRVPRDEWFYSSETICDLYSSDGYSGLQTYTVDGCSVRKHSTDGWVRFEIEVYGNGSQTLEFQAYGQSSYGEQADWYALVDDMSWTPATESATVRFEVADGTFLQSKTYQPGDKFGTMPQPTRTGYVFAGWCKDEDLVQTVSSDDYVPFDGAHLYAKWKKTLALNNENWYESEMTYTTGEKVCRTDVVPEGGDEWGYGASYYSYIDFVVSGSGFFSFWVNMAGCAQYTILVDGESVGKTGYSYDYSGALSLSNWKKQNLTISGSGKHTVRLVATGSGYASDKGVVLVKDDTFEKYAKQSTLGAWTDKTKNYVCWVTDNLPALQSKYASDKTPKGRVLHAITTLLTAGENTSVQGLFKGFGYTIDYMTMHADGKLDFSKAPTGNKVVDTLIAVGEPLVKTALSDLESIPGSMAPFELTVDEFAYLDEGVVIDYGDVLYMRTALKGLLGLAYWSKAYNVEIDYDQLVEDKSGVALKTVSNEASLKTEKGWSGIDWLAPCDPDADDGRAPFKVVKAGTSVYVYVPREHEGAVDSLQLICENRATEKSFNGNYYSDEGMDECSTVSLVSELDNAFVFKFDVSKLSGIKIANVKLKRIYCYFTNEIEENWYSTTYAAWKSSSVDTERFILHQTKVADKIRNTSALTTAKGYVKEALQLWIEADAKVMARTDEDLHLIEYDGHDEIATKNIAAMRRNLPKALKSLNDGSVQEYEWIDMLTHSHSEKYEGTLADPVAANLNKLFTGEITRSVLPPSTSTEYFVPNMDELNPTLNGLFPDTTRTEWARLLDVIGVEHSEVRDEGVCLVTFDANGGTCEEDSREVEEGETLGWLPEAEKRNAEFRGWWTAKTGGTQVTEETVVKRDVTYYAHWMDYKTVKLTVGNGFTYDPETGEEVKSTTLLSGESAELCFDESLICDKWGNPVGAFQKWVVTPVTADLGEDFNAFDSETTIRMPDTDVAVKAQYVAAVGAYVTYEFATEGCGEEEVWFCWSPDKGKTLIPSERSYPLATGSVTVEFYAKNAAGKASAEWKAPPSVKLTVPKASAAGAEEWYFEEWFVAADGATEIRFDANGGKVTAASRWYLDGGDYYALPEPDVRKGYVFDGWYTAKTGGEYVQEGSSVDLSLLDSKKPTLYAHWLKAYTLTLKGEGVTAEYAGREYEKTASVLEGGEVTLRAPERYEDSKGAGYLFQCWTPAKAYDFGAGYSALSCETTLVMPAANLTMTASYVKESEAAWLTMYAYAEPVETGEGAIEPDYSQFLWSVDGKTWFGHGQTALLKKGAHTVQWKSAGAAWAAPTAKTKVTLAAGDSYDNQGDPAVFTFVLAAKLTAVVYEDGAISASAAGGTATMNPVNGQIPKGKALTLTAKPAKGYAFVGWQSEMEAAEEGLCPFSSASTYKLDTFGCCGTEYRHVDAQDGLVHLQAVFRPISDYTEDDVRRLFRSVNGEEPDYTDDFSGSYEVVCGLGCSLELYLECSTAALPLTYTLSGTLPKGVKFDTATGLLSGTPTAAGTHRVSVRAADPAGHVCTLAVTLAVKAVPSGEWRALLTDESGAYAGLFEMSITDAGKASGKIVTASATTSVTPTVSWQPDDEDPDGDGYFHIFYEKSTGSQKSGSSVRLTVYPTGSELYKGRYVDPTYVVWYRSETWKNGETTSSVDFGGTALRSDAAMLKDPGFQKAFLDKYHTVALYAESGDAEGYRTPSELMAPGFLTLTVDKKGTVKVAGKLADGEKISASTVLLPSAEGDSASAVLFLVPSGYKKQGSVALRLDFSSDGAVTSSVGAWVTPPLLAAIAGVEAEDEIFLPGLLSLAANGGVYSALSDLTGYYLSLAVSEGGATPALEYTYTEGKEKFYDLADPALTEFGIDSESGMLVGGKSGKITVGKSAAPWKDKEGTWHYDETAKGEPILNPAGLTIAYKPATGVYSGKFNLFFDYETTKAEHKAVSCSYEGVLVGDGESGYAGIGSAQYSGKFTYEHEAKGKAATKTYTKKYALPVSWSVE